ncbi:uracil-DNA glycosylase [Hydrogenophaga sp.]|uniref:uracil-DNA glycosylase n=1 Tax=Hydrogenophaga sp. TaxID=1904254 RepID=UPI00271B3691|nr:uracil-DNA glycosylase [Hydrogenophaga sp.]MDO9436807.1 uracil-DNA glycosylase [Hydrogenophaga sp.]
MAVQEGFEWGAPSAAPRLTSAEPSNWPVQPGWADLVSCFWATPQGQSLQQFLEERLAHGAVVYPPHPLRALDLTAPEAVRVVILGQDPYHGPAQAEGLAFSVAPGVKVPPSLRNMLQELQRDLAVAAPVDGSLVRWARQGVLLLNTGLTVEDGHPASHAGRGWETLTDAIIRHCSELGGPKVFLLWGAHAQKKLPLIDSERHLVLSANHPSPLSARRGPVPFVGCGHFGKVNAWLIERQLPPVTW